MMADLPVLRSGLKIMIHKKIFIAGLIALATAAGTALAAGERDKHSYAEPEKISTKHLALDLSVDFDKRELAGTATLQLERKQPTDTLLLDTRDLRIAKVEAGRGNSLAAVPFELKPADKILGSALAIKLPADADTVRVHYASSPQASGLQWLTPAMTAGKKHPFMFSQAQAIHARSFIPLQDTPQVRLTYSATVRTPKHLRAVMSADNNPEKSADGVYRFTMPQALPSYLIAIAAGDLAFKPMSERTGVYAEPATLDAAAKEFADTEAMVKATEKLYGPYAWGRYDLLILPPSFPFGGMENPRLSFITPTVIAGDKSLVSLIAHELAHSWSGNLVTNATWEDLWLNEGFTTYVENRIMEAIYGRDQAVMEQVLGVKELLRDLERAEPADRVLHVKLDGRDPDDVFSRIPYAKGALFLHYLEEKFGRNTFDAFVRGYFAHFQFRTLNHSDFRAYIEKELINKHPGKVDMKKVDEWMYAQGLPADAPQPHSPRFDHVLRESAVFLAGKRMASGLKTQGWSTQEWLFFLDHLPKPLDAGQMRALDDAFKFTQSGNAEIAHAWLQHAIISHYKPAWPRLEQYLSGIGRRKLVVPLYELLSKRPEDKAFAIKVFNAAKPGYHPLTTGSVAKVLGVK